MKKILLFLFIITAGFAVHAQELAPDQNPNYKTSLDKYKASQVSLQSGMNTTVQDTYKAYDWATAKAERRLEKRNSRLYYNNSYRYTDRYYSPYYSNYSNSFNYYSPAPYQHRYYGHRWHR